MPKNQSKNEDNKKREFLIEECLNWIAEKKVKIEKSLYGKNKHVVQKALLEQQNEAKIVALFEKEVNNVLSQAEDDDSELKEKLQMAYADLLETSKKKIACLENVLQISSMEEDCGTLSHLIDNRAVALTKLVQERQNILTGEENIHGFVSPSAQDCVFAVHDNWTWIDKLSQCIRVHLNNASDYHQYFHDVRETSHWMLQDMNSFTQGSDLRAMKGDFNDSQQILHDLKEMLVFFRQWEAKTDSLWARANKVLPVHYRTQEIQTPMPARAICDYETEEIRVREGEELLLLENKTISGWKVRNCRGQVACVPPLTVIIPGPCKEAVDDIIRLRLQLMTEWTKAMKNMGKKVLCFMLLAFKPTYTEDEIKHFRSIEKLDKNELLRIVDFIENTLKVHWSDHEGFINLQERLLMMRMILEESTDEILQDEDRYKSLVMQITMLEKIMQQYKDLWVDWEKYKVVLETSRAPEMMLILERWEQLRFVPRDYLAKCWKMELPLDELEKKIVSLRQLTIDGATDLVEEGFDDETETFDEQTATIISEISAVSSGAASNLIDLSFGVPRIYKSTDFVEGPQYDTLTTEEGIYGLENLKSGTMTQQNSTGLTSADQKVIGTEQRSFGKPNTVQLSDPAYGDIGLVQDTSYSRSSMSSTDGGVEGNISSQVKSEVANSYESSARFNASSTNFEKIHGDEYSELKLPEASFSAEFYSNDLINKPVSGSSQDKGLLYPAIDHTKEKKPRSAPRTITAAAISERETTDEEMIEECTTVETTPFEKVVELIPKVAAAVEGQFGYAKEIKTAETEQLSAAEMEEQKTFMIRSVIDPESNLGISLQDAILKSIIIPDQGVYHNAKTGESIPIPIAMTHGLIKVEFTSVKRGKEKTSTIGIITVKTIREAVRPYIIEYATDTDTGEKLRKEEAIDRGIIEESRGVYIDRKSRRNLLIMDAIEKGLVDVRYEGDLPEPEVISQAYAVRAVVDRRRRRVITFHEAVQRGIINKESGAFKDTLTGDSMYVGDAIMRGFLKARPIDNPNSLQINPEDKMLIDKTDLIRKKIMKPLSVIAALKKAAQIGLGASAEKSSSVQDKP